MARTTATNFSGGLQFPYATAATDLFKKEDVQTLALAVDGHDHSAGKGLVLAASAIPPITSAMITDGTIATADIAANAIHQVIRDGGSGPEGTTSAALVPLSSPKVVITSVGGVLVAWFAGSFANSGAAGNANNYIGMRLDGAAFVQFGFFVTPGAGYAVPVSMVVYYGAPAAGSHTIEVGMGAGAGTLSTSNTSNRELVVVEFKR